MIRCPRCLRPHSGPRTATNLVAAITRVSHQMLGLEDDKARMLLRLQLRVLAAELDGYCPDHCWERAAEELHLDAGALALGLVATPPSDEQIEERKIGEGARGGAGADRPAEPGASSGGRVIPLRRDLGVRFRGKGTVYEQSAGEPLHATCRADAPEDDR